MKLREIMTNQVVRIHPEESVAVAARTLTHYNIGILPVTGSDGRLCGLVTDRDIVTRCGGKESGTDHGGGCDDPEDHCGKAGYGCFRCGRDDGSKTDPSAAGDGKREAVRYGQPGRPGTQRGKQWGSRGRTDGNQQQCVQKIGNVRR